ncbi:glycosyltransferase [Microbacterium sp. ZW T5_56]|uniref:glycosyltransferase n=1 Tax=Microbacterium sp. ZW T5_56 TaxID=3378081 RepID=UPI0038555D6A
MIVVIPAYEPGGRLVPLVESLVAAGLAVIVVDDGSGVAFVDVFADAQSSGATLLRHDHNRGKGAALRTAFAHIAEHHPDVDVITADSDGQHTVTDILHVAAELAVDRENDAPTLILGCRRFDADQGGRPVPTRSRVGNRVSAALFRFAAGWALSDTQTGLRGIPAGMIEWLRQVHGDRFEYELNMLLHLRRSGFGARELPIQTVYLDHNASSHFRPFTDSIRVITPLLVFLLASFSSFVIDTVVLLVLTAATGAIVPAVIGARVISGTANFLLNRRLVFTTADRSRAATARAAMRYAVLAGVMLLSNVVWMAYLTDNGVHVLLAKVITECTLLVIGFRAQRSFVFRESSPRAAHTLPSRVPAGT